MKTKDITKGARDFADYMADGRIEIVGHDGEPIPTDGNVSYRLHVQTEARKFFGVEFTVDDLREAFISDPRFCDIAETLRPLLLIANETFTLDNAFTKLAGIFDSQLALTEIDIDEGFETVTDKDVEQFIRQIAAILAGCLKSVGEGYYEAVVEKAFVIAHVALRWKGVDIWAHPDAYFSRYPSEAEALEAWAKANNIAHQGPLKVVWDVGAEGQATGLQQR